MKRTVGLLILIFFAALAFAGDRQPPRQCAHDPRGHEDDVKQIKAWVDRYCATVTAGDFETYRTFWSEDVVWLPPNAAVRKGIEACMEYNRPLFEHYKSVETMSVEEVQVAGGFAFARVNYTYRGTPKTDAKPREEDGKGIFLFRRRPDGSWVATHCVWNSNIALPDG